MKKLLLIVGYLGLVSFASGMRVDKFTSKPGSQDFVKQEPPKQEEPERGFFDSLRQGLARLKGKLTGGKSGAAEASKNSVPSAPVDVSQSVSGAGNVDATVEGPSAKEVKAIGTAGKPTVNFADQVRSVFGRKSQVKSRTFDELNEDIADLNALKNKREAEIDEISRNKNAKWKDSNVLSREVATIDTEIVRLKEVRAKQFPKEIAEAAKVLQKADQNKVIQAIRDSKRPILVKTLSTTPQEADKVLDEIEAGKSQKRDDDVQAKTVWEQGRQRALKENKGSKSNRPIERGKRLPRNYELPPRPTTRQVNESL